MKILQNIKPIVEMNPKQIFVDLHNIALEKATITNYQILNSAIVGKGTNAKFTSPGVQILQIILTDSKEIIDKTKCINALQTYIKYFANFTDTLTDDDVSPIFREKLKHESVHYRGDSVQKLFRTQNNILFLTDKLFESTQEQDEETAKQNNSVLIGYQLRYEFDSSSEEGFKERLKSVEEYAKKHIDTGKNLLSDVYTSIINSIKDSSFKFSSLWGGGGDTVKIGDLAVNLNYREIGAQETTSSIESKFSEEFPGLTPTISVIDSSSMLRYLKRHPKLKKKIKQDINIEKKLLSTKFLLAIKIDKRDKGYELISKKEIADIINGSIKKRGLGKITNPNYVKSTDIIYINNYEDNLKSKSDSKYTNKKLSDENNDAEETTKESIKIHELMTLLFERIDDVEVEREIYNVFYKDDNIDLNLKLKDKLLDDKNKSDLKPTWIKFIGTTPSEKYDNFKAKIESIIKSDGSIVKTAIMTLTTECAKSLCSDIKRYKEEINKEVEDTKSSDEENLKTGEKNAKDAEEQNKDEDTGFDCFLIPMKHLKMKTSKDEEKSAK